MSHAFYITHVIIALLIF